MELKGISVQFPGILDTQLGHGRYVTYIVHMNVAQNFWIDMIDCFWSSPSLTFEGVFGRIYRQEFLSDTNKNLNIFDQQTNTFVPQQWHKIPNSLALETKFAFQEAKVFQKHLVAEALFA